ncbi:MAG: cyclic lactone autoinducer peptide [Romboutsia sp.]
MDFLINAVANMAQTVANGVSTYCILLFFEPELPESLREE